MNDINARLLQLVSHGNKSNEQIIVKVGNVSFIKPKSNYYTHEDLMDEIISHKGNINDIVYPDDYMTFLNKAVYHDWPTVVKYLLEHGAENFISCKYFVNSVSYCLEKRIYDTADLLLKYHEPLITVNFDYYRIMDLCFEKGYYNVARVYIKIYQPQLCPSWSLSEIKFYIDCGIKISSEFRYSLQNNLFDMSYVNTKYDQGYYKYYVNYYDDDYNYYYDSDYSESESETDSDSGSESESDTDPEEPIYNYMEIDISKSMYEKFKFIVQKLVKRRWTFVKCYVGWLGLHQRAVISANHPNRLKQLGYFNVNDFETETFLTTID